MVGERSSERKRSTRDGHPEVKQEQEQHLFFLLLANTNSQVTHFIAYTVLGFLLCMGALHISLNTRWLCESCLL